MRSFIATTRLWVFGLGCRIKVTVHTTLFCHLTSKMRWHGQSHFSIIVHKIYVYNMYIHIYIYTMIKLWLNLLENRHSSMGKIKSFELDDKTIDSIHSPPRESKKATHLLAPALDSRTSAEGKLRNVYFLFPSTASHLLSWTPFTIWRCDWQKIAFYDANAGLWFSLARDKSCGIDARRESWREREN